LSFSYLIQGKYYIKVKVFIASIANINKALINKVKTDPYIKLLEHFYKFLEIFSQEKAVELPLYYRVSINYKI
jgi:hypothetical protein